MSGLVTVTPASLTEIAEAIRSRNGESEQYTVSETPEKIRAIKELKEWNVVIETEGTEVLVTDEWIAENYNNENLFICFKASSYDVPASRRAIEGYVSNKMILDSANFYGIIYTYNPTATTKVGMLSQYTNMGSATTTYRLNTTTDGNIAILGGVPKGTYRVFAWLI